MIHPGDRIGDWIIMEPLGAGGMGSIFAARSVLSERVKAACKVMHTREGFATRDRFIREVDTAHAATLAPDLSETIRAAASCICSWSTLKARICGSA